MSRGVWELPEDERWQEVDRLLRLFTKFVRIGEGSPEGSVVAEVGGVYLRTDGGASTTFYVKESGTGSTGWVAK